MKELKKIKLYRMQSYVHYEAVEKLSVLTCKRKLSSVTEHNKQQSNTHIIYVQLESGSVAG
jgi:hypothetical protein